MNISCIKNVCKQPPSKSINIGLGERLLPMFVVFCLMFGILAAVDKNKACKEVVKRLKRNCENYSLVKYQLCTDDLTGLTGECERYAKMYVNRFKCAAEYESETGGWICARRSKYCFQVSYHLSIIEQH